MADELNLRFRVFNAGVAEREIAVEHNGEPAVLKQRKLYIDAEPLDGTEKTLELALPASLEGQIGVGTVLTLAVTFDAPDAELPLAADAAEVEA